MELAATVAVSTETGNKKNPNQPVTAVISAAAVVSAENTAAVISAENAAVIAITATKQKDNPYKISTHHSAGTGI